VTVELDQALRRLDAEPAAAVEKLLFGCCSSRRFCSIMLERRPWPTPDALFSAAEQAAEALSEDDWLEAFAHHPRIGESALRARFASEQASSWSTAEQAGMANATEDLIGRLADGNRRYEARFGFLFLICATGKSARAMLEALEARLAHDRATELEIAIAEQKKITRLRLEKMLSEL
jgi:2-oxo-4-hydroxy-4-carboxy-5-ureidoimidazoline decarboxylase